MAVISQSGETHSGRGQGAGKLGEELPFWSLGKIRGRSGKSESSTHPLLGSSPIIPALLFLGILVVLFAFVESQHWLGTASGIPSPREVLALFRSHGSPLPQENVRVWTKKQTGFYYCQGNLLFGRKPGKMMDQTEALLAGYRPVLKEYCTSNKPEEESKPSASARTTADAK
ncbi:MAG TPA: hypothetical protein VNM47_06030 [Terriglobia bacterium]|nr:hypothetical protein [Terriglobia bacterium]